MDIQAFIDLGIKAEEAISGLYESASRAASTESKPELASRFKQMAHEEIGHANVLKMGRNYATAMPDLFSARRIDISGIRGGLEESLDSISGLSSGKSLKPLLESILDLEKRFERLHLGASVAITDDSLRNLFSSLSKGDAGHIEILTKIIADMD